MSASNENVRLETFCDGVFAIAITLLILEIKVPPVHTVHSSADLWREIGRLWPHFFSFALAFIIVLIAWFNHHGLIKLLDGSSPHFLFANGFFLLTIVVLPYPTSMMAEYIGTPYVQPAIFLFCLSTLIHNIGWNILFESALAPVRLTNDSGNVASLYKGRLQCRQGLALYGAIVALAWWFPYVALGINTIIWAVWIYVGLTLKDVKKKPEPVAPG